MRWVFENTRSTGATRFVLLTLAYHARPDGTEARPAIDTLAREATVHRATVQAGLKWGRDHGEIEQTRVTASGIRVYAFPGVVSRDPNR